MLSCFLQACLAKYPLKAIVSGGLNTKYWLYRSGGFALTTESLLFELCIETCSCTG